MSTPSVSRYMTRQPFTIEKSASLPDARKVMLDHGIRHLPVIDPDGTLVGIVSERTLLAADKLLRFTPEAVVGDAMTERPFIVTGDVALVEVVEIMAEKKYGSAIVMGRDGVEGIFTMVDACRALADTLNQLER
jgi:acetoin utilization protein AcuB